uniref:Actin-related protein 2/3 complex subunit 3 n=1 Tax=Caenorhabditis tropicalis TaxID=1561998 RepID=A0A1I7UPE4_9PELO
MVPSFDQQFPTDKQLDIIDEALNYFKPNIFFREFEIKGPADRTLIYLIFYITECLRKLQKSPNKIAGQKDLNALALSHLLPIPGENGFPLNSMYKAPQSKPDEDEMRAYLQQLRQELGARLCDLVFPDPHDRPSKWWLCFSRRRFMDKGLVGQGVNL